MSDSDVEVVKVKAWKDDHGNWHADPIGWDGMTASSASRVTKIDKATGWLETYEREPGSGGFILVSSTQIPELVRIVSNANALAEAVLDEFDGCEDIEDGADGPRANMAMRLCVLAKRVM